MKWIIDDIKRGWAQLQRWQTWLTIFLIAGFAVLAYLVASYAFKTDSVLSYLRLTNGHCRTMSNGLIIAMFTGMIFFMLTAMLTIGEAQRYFQSQQRRAYRDAAQAIKWGIFWACCAICIAVAALVFFKANCY
ncbi:hypothetical protein BJN45_05400 [Azonexus hydrophilus]|uniref:Uncharacterized protein n=1 Tax=Azonexus hydrophilus TaxID=418702 RepID=A0A1R1I7K5_9RHOO|nr:hypothetical protein [Azonexus hydrophilus]OMG54657.1 hypothetical protein BJN45_05400 [Azonexus hydrophilus]